MTTQELSGYKNRLHKNDVVYFVDWGGAPGAPTAPVMVRKAMVYQNSPEGKHTVINLLDTIKSDPLGIGKYDTADDARSLFTHDEVERALNAYDGLLSMAKLTIDEMVETPGTNRELAVALGMRLFDRTYDKN